MSLILSGTDGLSDVDGTAATPAIRGTDANTGIFFPAADTIAFSEGGVEAARIDSAGNFGLGVSPATYSGSGVLGINVAQTGNGILGNSSNVWVSNNVSFNSGFKYARTTTATLYNQSGGSHVWSNAVSGTAGNAITFTDAMTLDGSGNLLVGTTSNTRPARLRVEGAETAHFTGYGNGFGVGLFMTPNASATGGTANAISFQNVSNATVGTIATTAGATAYNTSSDYRLKEAIAPMTGALAKVALLKPCTYKWKVDGSDGQGFIAHELDEVVSGCVTGEKDGVDAEGNPKYQGIDTSFLVATLTAAIQELNAKFEAYKATHP